MKIPLSSPDITESEIAAVTSVLRTSRLSLGPQMQAFERVFADSSVHHTQSPLALARRDFIFACGLSTSAAETRSSCRRSHLLPPPMSSGIGEPHPVFVDIEPDTLNMSPACIEAAITYRTRAILVVHTFGRPAEMAAILDIARRHKLCCH